MTDKETRQYIWMDKYRRGIAVSTIAREHQVSAQYIYRTLAKLCGAQWGDEQLQHNMARPGAQERLHRREVIQRMALDGHSLEEIVEATSATVRLVLRTISPSARRHMTRYQSIIFDYEQGMLQKDVAAKYAIGQSTVSSIINRYRGLRSPKTRRNREIIRARRSGATIKHLAQQHGLTERRIQAIIATGKWEEREVREVREGHDAAN